MTELKGWALGVLSACLLLRLLEWMGVSVRFEKHLRLLFGIAFALAVFAPLVSGEIALPEVSLPPAVEEASNTEETLLTLVEGETESRLKKKLEGVFSKLEVTVQCKTEADGGMNLNRICLSAPKAEMEFEATAGWKVYQSTGIWPEFDWEE